MFITLEGIDGCGKSTLALNLKRKLELLGFKVFLTKEPGGSNLGKDIKKIILNKNISPITEFLLFAADREVHAKIIKQHLHKGEIVISDRFADSSIAYQGYGKGVDIDFINEVNNKVLGDLKPDVTFIIDIPIYIMQERLGDRSLDKIERMSEQFFNKVRTGYILLSQDPRFYVIDGTYSPREVLSQTLNILLTFDEIKKPALQYLDKIESTDPQKLFKLLEPHSDVIINRYTSARSAFNKQSKQERK